MLLHMQWRTRIRMRARKPESELEEIPAAECWELLGRHDMGRIAIVVDGKPQIFPVNHGLKGKVIVFRTAAGTKLANAPESPVAFEVDEYDSSAGSGWSWWCKALAATSPRRPTTSRGLPGERACTRQLLATSST